MSRRNGYVYVYGGEGTYKIGWAKNPEARIASWPLMPWPCEIVLTIKSKDAIALESHLHQHFASKRVNGEWFSLSEADLATIPTLVEQDQPVCKTKDISQGVIFPLLALRQRLETEKGAEIGWVEIARAANLNPNTVYNLAANRSKRVAFETLTKLYNYFRAEGLEITPGDLLTVEEVEAA